MTGSLSLSKVNWKGDLEVSNNLGLATSAIKSDAPSFEEAKSGYWTQGNKLNQVITQAIIPYGKTVGVATAIVLIASWPGIAPSSNIIFDSPLVIDSKKETSTVLHTAEPLSRKRVSRKEAAQLAIDILLKAEERRILSAEEEANNSSFWENENDL